MGPAGTPSSSTSTARAYALFALGVIFFANFLSYLDRQIVSALEHELREAYGLHQDAFGALWTAFTLGYMVFAPVIGFMTDRYRRTRIFAVCVFLWSLATIASGLAPNAPALFASRFFIGIGEAGCLVIGPTLIADFFAKEVRGRALSVFFLGLPLGGTAGYLLPGFIAGQTGTWRYAFFAAGLPGIALSALIWTMVDPPRGGEEAVHERIRGFKPYLDLLKNRTLLLIILAQAFAVIMLVPLLHFGVGFFQDKHGMTKKEATTTLGAIALVAGALGNWLSGVIGDRLARRVRGSYALLAGIAFAFGLPWLVIGFTSGRREVFIPALMMGAFCYFLCMPAVNTQIANVVSARQRAMAFAAAVFILHLLGDTMAPTIFGGTSEALGKRLGSEVLGRQYAYVGFSCALVLASICALLASRTAGQDEERAARADEVRPIEPETGTG